MKTAINRRRVVTAAKRIALTALFLAVFAYASNSDYRDELKEEAQNNGLFYELAEQFPDKSEEELLDIYEELVHR